MFITYSTCIVSQEVFRYISSVDHVDQNLWIKQFERSFDSAGIITQKKEYHALTIAGFGIMSYENFITSNDSAYYKHAINQFKYFCDSSKVDYIENYQGMGLPYKFKFQDLKPPWYSGMTQGVGISFMLRYYLLTGNSEALKKAEQLAYFMLQPEELGGTIGKTPEGYTFIEEYPNSRSNPQVLNGFINGLIGLREYLNFFPDDTLAQRIHDESYEAMIKTFREYDLPINWSTYNRKNKSLSTFYMRYQITELEFLNFIYSDYRLVKQMMLWSYFAFNKIDKNLSDYKNPRYQYAIPFQIYGDTLTTGNIDFEKTLQSETKYLITRNSKSSDHQLKHKKTYQINLKDSVYSLQIYFDREIESTQWTLNQGGLSNVAESFTFEIDSNKMVVLSDKKFNQFDIQFLNKKEKKLNIDDLQVYNNYQFDIPRFGFYNFTYLPELQADTLYKIESDGEFLDETLVFYRFAENSESMKKAKYEINNTISLRNPYFTPEQTGVYQFFLVSPMIKGYWLKKPMVKLVQE